MNHHRFSEEIERVLTRLPQEEETKFRTYFENAPAEVLSMLSLEKRYADRYLVEENDPIDRIYILLEGQVKAVDFRVKGSSYEYARFDGVSFLGSMECVFGEECYMANIITVTPCTLASLPRRIFENWISSDLAALCRETRMMRQTLLENSRENRMLLLLNGMERLIYLLVKKCRSRGEGRDHILAVNRQELAEQCGTSVKTVNRSMKRLEDSGFLTREGHKVKITQRQYAAMQEYLGLILN